MTTPARRRLAHAGLATAMILFVLGVWRPRPVLLEAQSGAGQNSRLFVIDTNGRWAPWNGNTINAPSSGQSGGSGINARMFVVSSTGAWVPWNGALTSPSGPFLAPNGTAAAPAYSWANSPTSGAYRIGADNIGYSAAGVLRWDYNTTRISSTIPFLGSDGTAGAPSYSFASHPTTGLWLRAGSDDLVFSSAGTAAALLNSARIRLRDVSALEWSSGTDPSTTASDLFLFRDAASTLAQRNGTNAQEHRWYQTFTDASNYSRLVLKYDGGTRFILTTEAAGSGTVKGLLVSAGTGQQLDLGSGGSTRWSFLSTGHFVATADNTYDIGAAGATRPRSIFVGTNITVGNNGIFSGNVQAGASATAYQITSRISMGSTADGVVQFNNSGATRSLTFDNGGIPTCPTNCGTSPTITGTNSSFTITMGASGTTASGFVATFSGTWAAAPQCHVTMALAGMVVGKMPLTVATTTTTATVVTNGTNPANSDKYHFQCSLGQ